MSLSGLRWRMQQTVRSALLRTTPAHPLRRAYRALRAFPPIRAAWSLVTGGELHDWRDAAGYARHKGAFAPTRAGAPAAPPPAFDSAEFFPDLLARIAANHPPETDPTGPVVLVNNGLSAGGAERQIVFTLIGLKARGVPAVFVGEYLGRAPELDFHLPRLEAAGVECLPLPNVTRPGAPIYAHVARPVAESLARMPVHLMVEMLDLVTLLRRLKPRAVHLWQDETSTKHGLAALIAGAPRVILSGRNVNPTHFVFHQPFMKPAYLALSTSPRIVLSNNSRAGAQSYAEWLGLPEERFRVVYNAVDLDAWPDHGPDETAAFRARLGFAPDRPLIAGVFRLADEKRPLLWVEAAAALKARRPDAAFFIAGEGPMRAEVEAAVARLGLQSSLRLLGEIKDVSLALAAADAFFLASKQEGTPNALLEAQRYGLACLITRAGGAEEALDPEVTGRVAREDAPRALGAALADLLADPPLRARARAEGPVFVRRRFGLKRMIDETLALYDI